MNFFKDIVDLAKTAKFWAAFVGAVVNAALVFVADYPEFAPLVSVLAAFGVYEVPNKQ